jgi:hypothetical protein
MAASPSDRKLLGVFIGAAFAIAWAFFAIYVESMTIAYHQNAFQNTLLAWINLGPVPLLIVAGMYYFTRLDLSDARRQEEFAGLKGLAIGFFLWILAILFLQVQQMNDENYLYPTIAGYLLMLVLVLVFQGKSRSPKPDTS